METSLTCPLDGFVPDTYHSWFVPNRYPLFSISVKISVRFSFPQGQGQCLVDLCTHTVPDIPNLTKL